MKLIGVFILALELVALSLQLKNECGKNGFTFDRVKKRYNKVRSRPLFTKISNSTSKMHTYIKKITTRER